MKKSACAVLGAAVALTLAAGVGDGRTQTLERVSDVSAADITRARAAVRNLDGPDRSRANFLLDMAEAENHGTADRGSPEQYYNSVVSIVNDAQLAEMPARR